MPAPPTLSFAYTANDVNNTPSSTYSRLTLSPHSLKTENFFLVVALFRSLLPQSAQDPLLFPSSYRGVAKQREVVLNHGATRVSHSPALKERPDSHRRTPTRHDNTGTSKQASKHKTLHQKPAKQKHLGKKRGFITSAPSLGLPPAPLHHPSPSLTQERGKEESQYGMKQEKTSEVGKERGTPRSKGRKERSEGKPKA